MLNTRQHPTAATALCLALERAINKALQYDPATAERLKRQAGRSIALELSEPTIVLSITFTEDGVQASPLTNKTADCHLSGTVSSLIELMSGPKTTLAGSDLTLTGQTGFLMELLEIAKSIDIDWEEALCQYLGDYAGHAVAELVRYKAGHVKRIANRSPRFLGDFITEELRAVPAEPELEAFYNTIDDLQDDVARIEARIKQLMQASNSPTRH